MLNNITVTVDANTVFTRLLKTFPGLSEPHITKGGVLLDKFSKAFATCLPSDFCKPSKA